MFRSDSGLLLAQVVGCIVQLDVRNHQRILVHFVGNRCDFDGVSRPEALPYISVGIDVRVVRLQRVQAAPVHEVTDRRPAAQFRRLSNVSRFQLDFLSYNMKYFILSLHVSSYKDLHDTRSI